MQPVATMIAISLRQFPASIPPALWGAIGLVTLYLLYVVLSWKSQDSGNRLNPLAVAIGADGRYSSSKLQFAIWTATVMWAYITIFAAFKQMEYATSLIDIGIPPFIMIAMGISTVTIVGAKAITVNKLENGQIQKTPPSAALGFAGSATTTPPAGGTPATGARLSQVFLDDDSYSDLSKIQMVSWTLIAVVVYVMEVLERVGRMAALGQMPGFKTFRGALADGTMTPSMMESILSGTLVNNVHEPIVRLLDSFASLPDIDPSLMILMGLGQGAYLGKKLVTNYTPRLRSLAPSSGTPGSTVQIAGEAFGEVDGQVLVNGDPVPTRVGSWTDRSITFELPEQRLDGSNWPHGQVLVGVMANGIPSANSLPFVITDKVPSITKLPSTARPQDEVTIEGANFGAPNDNLVVLVAPGSRELTRIEGDGIKEWNDDKIRFKLPLNDANGRLLAGQVFVEVQSNGRKSQRNRSFSIVHSS